ncbi:Translation initiation factor 3 subunit J component [Mortierella polycephala]|uniref:Eukaryotic translation initiation factor 3 subunit J n=1 Tax=Mortierella polycephala TaxID=41804 RepID=A0A9P6PSS8_9FUNG|nr:Translation initiation factor 3 subunit J component [Mortierella polycephala]
MAFCCIFSKLGIRKKPEHSLTLKGNANTSSNTQNDDIAVPVIPAKKQWDDEDVDEDDIKEDWDASSESESEPEIKAPVVKAPKMTLTEKIALRNEEEERRKQAALEKIAKIPEHETEEEKFERRQREKNAIIESDIANAADLFSGVKVADGVVVAASKLETMKPKTKDQFNEFTTELVTLIQKHEKQGLYASFLEGLFRELSQGVRDTDVRKFSSSLTTLANEKQKAAKEALKTKKKGSSKPSLSATKVASTIDTLDYSNDYNDDFDDFINIYHEDNQTDITGPTQDTARTGKWDTERQREPGLVADSDNSDTHSFSSRDNAQIRPASVALKRHYDTLQYSRGVKLCTKRGLMTQSNQQGPILRYSEDEDSGSPQNYNIRVGRAIRTLREELPQFFDHGLCTTSIYASNVRLIEASHTNVSLQGRTIYFLLAGAVRWSFKMWFRDIEFEIQSIRVNGRGGPGSGGTREFGGMGSGDDGVDSASTFSKTSHSTITTMPWSDSNSTTQRSMQESTEHWKLNRLGDDSTRKGAILDLKCIDKLDGTLESNGFDKVNRGENNHGNQESLPPTTVTVRWTLKGTTRPSVVLTSSGPTPPPPSTFSGVFVYQFNDRGLIDEHRIENIMPSPSPEAIERAFALWGWLLGRTRPAAAATSSEGIDTRKRLGLGCVSK